MSKKKRVTWATAPELLTAQQTADLLATHIDTIHRMLKTGKLPGFKLPNGYWRIRKADLAGMMGQLEAIQPTAAVDSVIVAGRQLQKGGIMGNQTAADWDRFYTALEELARAARFDERAGR